MTLDAARRWAVEQLQDNSSSPQLDAEVLLAHLLERPRSYLRTWPERPLSSQQQEAFSLLVQQRREGEPVAYLTGQREFWSLELRVTRDTLIPRPETELLVAAALQRIPAAAAWSIADLGTGSGAIALALASERPQCRVVATDVSAAALTVARSNALRLTLEQVEFRHGDWVEPLRGERFQMVVSNPPYIALGDPHLVQDGLPYEPQRALSSGLKGLDALVKIIATATEILSPPGWLLLEHGYDQGGAVRELFTKSGYTGVVTLRDDGGQERLTLATCRS